MNAVDSPQAFKQLFHEVDHSAVFSAEVTDQYSCNCASPVCLLGEHRDNFKIYLFFWRNDFINYVDVMLAHRNRGQYGVTEQCVILQHCVVSKHRMLLSGDQY